MSILVEQQDETINIIEAQAGEAEKDVETGWEAFNCLDASAANHVLSLGYTDKAVSSARAARKKRWICFIIFLIILAIVGVVVGIQVAKNNK